MFENVKKVLQQRREQLSVALHIDVVLNLIVLSTFLFVRELDIFAYIVVILCPIYAASMSDVLV